MSDHDPQLPETLRQALKNKAAYTPPESFYTDVLRKIRTAPEPRSRLAWIWGTPMKLATVMGVIMISYFAAQDKTPWGPKKAEVVYDRVSSVNRPPAMAQGPALPQTMAFKDMKTIYSVAKEKRSKETLKEVPAMNKKSLDALTYLPAIKIQNKGAAIAVPAARDDEEVRGVGGMKFPWQNQLQAGQTVSAQKSMRSTLAQSADAETWRGADSAISNFRTVVITTAQDWALFWQLHTQGQAPPAPLPAVDFDRSIVIGIFAGTRPDLAAVEILDNQELPDQVVVRYREIPVGPAAEIVNPASHPYELRIIPKTALPVHFQKEN